MTDDQQSGSSATVIHTRDDATSKVLLRLLIGLTLEGADELNHRLRDWEAKVAHNSASSYATDTGHEPLSDADRRYYALIGMLFAIRQRAERDMAGWVTSPVRAAQHVVNTADRLSRNPLLRPFVKPVKNRADAIGQHISDEVERWIVIGQAEEQHSRAVARVAVPDVIDEVLQILADNPELQSLIQQQSVGLAEEVVDSVREVTVTADAVLEGVVRKVLNRKPRQQLPKRDTRLLAEPKQNGNEGGDDRS